MKFTPSKDGAERATVQVKFRVDRAAYAYAIALHAYGSNPEAASLIVSQMTKDEADRIVRAQFLSGPPEAWQEMGGTDDHPDFAWNDTLEMAQTWVEEKYGRDPRP